MPPPPDSVPPPRSGLERLLIFLISSWESRHLRVWAGVRLAIGAVEAAIGVVVLLYGVYWLAALLLVAAVLTFSFGYWEMTLARRQADDSRSGTHRT